MNWKRVIGVAVAVGLIAVLLRESPEPAPPEPASTDAGMAEASAGVSPEVPVLDSAKPQGPLSDTVDGRSPYDTGIRNDPRVQAREDGKRVLVEAVGIANEMDDPEGGPEYSMERLGEVLSFYRMVFDENPVASDNQSVMASLMGANARGLVFFPENHPALNADGELVDPWGAPYFFHALSGKQMEIVSTGPDRMLGSDDDLIHTQRDEDAFFKGFTEPAPEPEED